jgi:uncharacterized zinc-type alcohol dehydrogenase-like protein
MIHSYGYGTNHSFTDLKPITFAREDAKPNEVTIDVMYCGVCHSDIHQVKNEWATRFTLASQDMRSSVEFAAVGSTVTSHKVGDIVGVGCMIDSCRDCEPCRAGDENYCEVRIAGLPPTTALWCQRLSPRMRLITMVATTHSEATPT